MKRLRGGDTGYVTRIGASISSWLMRRLGFD